MTKAALIVATGLLAVWVQAEAAKKGKEITCSPKVLYPGDKLTIKTNQPFTYLGVTQPMKKATRALLVFPETAAVTKHSIIDADQFALQKKVALPVKTAEAWFGTTDGGAMLPVFPKAGSYVFEVGSNLAKSEDKTPYKCIVKYVAY
jgi:hypothetical protein